MCGIDAALEGRQKRRGVTAGELRRLGRTQKILARCGLKTWRVVKDAVSAVAHVHHQLWPQANHRIGVFPEQFAVQCGQLEPWTRQGYFDGMQNVVFLHTGGSAALFGYPNIFGLPGYN